MPVHDRARVEAGIFHDFHTVWIGALRNALNEGLLPEGYYALAEQHAGQYITDVLTLHVSPENGGHLPAGPPPGGTALAERPPRVRHKQVIGPTALGRRRTLAIRHVSGHRLVALVEILSPANKDRAETVESFAMKAVAALDCGVHLLLVDLFRPGPFDPLGMHGVISSRLDPEAAPYDLPANQPFTLASYAAAPQVEIYLEHAAIGESLPEMPLFLRPDRYVNVPLEETYLLAYRGTPEFWRELLERAPE
jgi:hypothetical protein